MKTEKQIAQEIADIDDSYRRAKEIAALDKSIKGTVRMYYDNIMLVRQNEARKRNRKSTRHLVNNLARNWK